MFAVGFTIGIVCGIVLGMVTYIFLIERPDWRREHLKLTQEVSQFRSKTEQSLGKILHLLEEEDNADWWKH